MSDLLPCPFCGDQPELPHGYGTQYEIECNCGMARSGVQISDLMTLEERMTGYDSQEHRFAEQFIERAKAEAVAAWNTRAPVTPADCG